MTDKIQEQKDAVAAMRAAKSNMVQVLARVETLERGLQNLIFASERLARYVPAAVYPLRSEKSVTEEHSASVAAAKALLPACPTPII